MFYDTRNNNHNMKYNPFKACVVPRPIGWISSIDNTGVVNIAPYSYFNAISDIPPMVMFASSTNKDGQDKDTIRNILQNGEFVVNIANFAMHQEMQLSSTPLPYGESEAEAFNIEMTSSHCIKTPRIKYSPISLECKYIKTISLDFIDQDNVIQPTSSVVIGHVVGIYIDDSVIVDGKIIINKLDPIARLGYNEYARIIESFTMQKNS